MIRTALIAALLIVFGGGFGNYLRYAQRQPDAGPDLARIPYELPGYTSEERRFSDVSYEVLAADTTTLRLVRDTSGTASWFFVAYFGSQQYGHQIHSPRHCLPGGGWTIREHGAVPVQLGGTEVPVNRLLIEHARKQQVMLYWFVTRSGPVANEFGLKFDLMVNALLLQPTDAAMVRVTTPLGDGDLTAATARAADLLRAVYPDLQRSLPFDT